MTFKEIQLPRVLDERGNLSIIEELTQIPFEIKRTYWIYDVPSGESRGQHAFRQNEEFIVALSGSFDLVLNDGRNESKIQLNRCFNGIYVPPLTWRSLENFSTNSLALILASRPYSKEDYVRDYSVFQSIVR